PTPTRREVAQHNLKSLALALYSYANNNHDDFPTDLIMLMPAGGICSPSIFWNAGDSDPEPTEITNSAPNALNSTQISYAYMGGSTDSPDGTLVMLDNNLANNGGSGLLAVTSDGAASLLEITTSPNQTVTMNLQQIGIALYLYAIDNNSRFPTKLSMLYPHYVANPTVFWHPGDNNPIPTTINNDLPDKPNSAQISYRYLGADYRTSCDAGVILLVDNSLSNNGWAGINIFTASGQVYFYAPVMPSCQLPLSCMSTAAANLRAIGMALYTYANENNDDFPTTFSMLYDYGLITNPRTFWNPGDSDPYPTTIDNDLPDKPNSSQISFEYLGAGRGAYINQREIVARDNTAANNGGFGIYALYADSHVAFIPSRTLTGIAITSGPDTVPEGGIGEYTCTATFDDGETLDVTAYADWSVSSGPGASSNGLFAAPLTVLADTPATIHVSFTDFSNITKQADKTITIQNGTRIMTGVAISGPATVNEGSIGSYTCTATYDDGSTQNVTTSTTWTVSSGPGMITGPGTYAAPATVLADTRLTLHVRYHEGGVTKDNIKTITVQKSAPPPQPADTDSDGVADNLDQCPATPTGSVVDANGCAASQRDSDGDGVMDNADQCASTPAGTAVDAKGCPLPPDADRDGVADANDRCPGTPAATAVNNAGCSAAQLADSDADGVIDSQDGCPKDANKTAPGTCGCGKLDTIGCGMQYTLRITSNQSLPTGEPAPQIHLAGVYFQVWAPDAPAGYHFSHWSGDVSETTNPIQIQMDRDMIIQANFEADVSAALDEPAAPRLIMPNCGFGASMAMMAAFVGLYAMRVQRKSSPTQ
ncbi:MAG TPA: thrombospondin type 3 repeat-containing protein, partial [Phycisphaerae bacterium]|nr:thrombospondin type 3 repeat-containing protein [Phycisphaerae bacterium]